MADYIFEAGATHNVIAIPLSSTASGSAIHADGVSHRIYDQRDRTTIIGKIEGETIRYRAAQFLGLSACGDDVSDLDIDDTARSSGLFSGHPDGANRDLVQNDLNDPVSCRVAGELPGEQVSVEL